MPAVLLGNISGLAQKVEDRLTGFIELIVVVSRALSRSSKWYHFGAHCCPSPCRTDQCYSGGSTPECHAVWIPGFFLGLWPIRHMLGQCRYMDTAWSVL